MQRTPALKSLKIQLFGNTLPGIISISTSHSLGPTPDFGVISFRRRPTPVTTRIKQCHTHCHKGVWGSPAVPPKCHGDPPNPSCCCRRGWGAEPPRVSVPGPVQMAEPGSSCPHGGDGANVTPATWHGALALSPSLSPAVGAPLSKRHRPGGAQAAPPELRGCREDGEHQHRWGPTRVTGTGGSPGWRGGTQHPPFTSALPRPRRRLKCPPGPPAPVTGSAYSCRL